MTSTSTSTLASVAAALARLRHDEIPAALKAANLSPELAPEVMMAIEVASIATAESANKRRLTAIDVRDDALGRVGTIQTLLGLLGQHMGSVCRRWRDSSRGLALRIGKQNSLVQAVAEDHTNPHLLANLGYYNVTEVDLSGFFNNFLVTDAAIIILVTRCRSLKIVDLRGCNSITDASIIALVKCCPNLTGFDLNGRGISADSSLWGCPKFTATGFAALATGSPKLTSINLSTCYQVTDAAIVNSLALGGLRNLTSVGLYGGLISVTDTAVTALVTGCTKLTTIDLCAEEGGISSAALMAFGTGHYPNLTALSINGPHCGPRDVP